MAIYGGFWIRVAAYIIDAIIVNIASALVGGIVGFVLGAGLASTGSTLDGVAGASSILGGLIGLVLSWLYFAIMESSSSQATVGKLALGLVVTEKNGEPISFARATGRYFAKILSAIILLVGFMMVGWTERKQGLHDMIASTVVTKKGTLAGVDRAASIFD